MTHNDADASLADHDTGSLGHVPAQSDEPPPPPVRRGRRRKLPIATLVLALLAAGGVGFYSGVRVEKGQLKTSSGTGSAATGFGFGNAASNRSGARSTPGPAASGAPGSGAPGGGTIGSANIVGTVTVVSGSTLYVTEANGDTVKVTTTDGTTVTRTVTGAVKDLAPGESVVIRGVQSSEGVYAAQSVTQGSAGIGAAFGGGNFGGRGSRSGATTNPTAAAGK
jgi:hypothetical protein